MVYELVNSLQTKCAYVWMGLQTCAVSSTNGSHTIRYELKCFLRKYKENWMHRVSFARLRFAEN